MFCVASRIGISAARQTILTKAFITAFLHNWPSDPNIHSCPALKHPIKFKLRQQKSKTINFCFKVVMIFKPSLGERAKARAASLLLKHQLRRPPCYAYDEAETLIHSFA